MIGEIFIDVPVGENNVRSIYSVISGSDRPPFCRVDSFKKCQSVVYVFVIYQ